MGNRGEQWPRKRNPPTWAKMFARRSGRSASRRGLLRGRREVLPAKRRSCVATLAGVSATANVIASMQIVMVSLPTFDLLSDVSLLLGRGRRRTKCTLRDRRQGRVLRDGR